MTGSASRIDGARLLADLRTLAEFGRVGTGVNRLSYSPEDVAARQWLCQRMRAAGLDARIDGLGSVYGRSPSARAILIGSHTDTVPKGGWLDGALGVLVGLEIARSRIASGEAGVDVISFVDEEGTFFSLLGSKSFCGKIQAGDLDQVQGRGGKSLRDAIAGAGFGGEFARVDRGRHLGYLEVHIEQGPRLESAGARIGIVTDIVGIRRFRVTVVGQADHAGTTPMALRRDAGAALIDLAQALLAGFPAYAAEGSVWNIGTIAFEPGAANVVPAAASMTVEFRDADLAVLRRMQAFLEHRVRVAGDRSGLPVTLESTAESDPVALDHHLMSVLADAATARGEHPVHLPSGAGHDAMIVGRVLPAALLFIPSIGGRSHDLAENTAEADIVLGAEVTAAAVDRLLSEP